MTLAAGTLLLLVIGAACRQHGVARPSAASQRLHDFKLVYPPILLSAGAEGEVVFEVRTDSAGRPLMDTFLVERSTNDIFASVVKRSLPKAQASESRTVRDSVVFRVFRTAEDSVKACAAFEDATIVCARQPEPTRRVIY